MVSANFLPCEVVRYLPSWNSWNRKTTFILKKSYRTSKFGRQGLGWCGHNIGIGFSFNPYLQPPGLICPPSILGQFRPFSPSLGCQTILWTDIIRNWPTFQLVLFFILCFSPKRCFPGLQRKSVADFFHLSYSNSPIQINILLVQLQ